MSIPILKSDHFRLGLFSSNCSGGLAVTKIPERWSASWEDNLRLAKVADETGIDFMLPIARWIGYGGDTNFHEGVLEPIPWATAILANTKRLNVFATIHTAFNHPVVTAKQLATIDQMAPGRIGVNVVAGWNQPEYVAMGVDLPQDHDSRYELAQEWIDVINTLWSREGRYDLPGRFWDLQGVESLPKPAAGRLPILNAGSSAQGKAYAARNADFVSYPTPNLAARKLLDAEVLADPAIYPPPQVLDRCERLHDRGAAIAKIEKVWREVRQ